MSPLLDRSIATTTSSSTQQQQQQHQQQLIGRKLFHRSAYAVFVYHTCYDFYVDICEFDLKNTVNINVIREIGQYR